MLRHVSSFAGCDAVGLAVRALGGETVAYSEFDPTPKSKKDSTPKVPDGEQYLQRLLAKRLPHAEAHGDVRAVDWKGVMERKPFDLFSAGFP